jgi:RNA polymerase sigma factor (sigma-70 family)
VLLAGARLAPVDEADVGVDGLEELYRAHASTLLAMLVVYVGDRALAEDLLQEAFLRVAGPLRRLREPDRAAAYLRSTAFNLARSSFRHRAVVERQRFDPERDAPSAEDGVVLRDDQRAVVDSLADLPRRQRECVILKFWGQLTEVEIAAALRVSQSSVKVHLRRAMSALAEQLEERR